MPRPSLALVAGTHLHGNQWRVWTLVLSKPGVHPLSRRRRHFNLGSASVWFEARRSRHDIHDVEAPLSAGHDARPEIRHPRSAHDARTVRRDDSALHVFRRDHAREQIAQRGPGHVDDLIVWLQTGATDERADLAHR